MPPDLRSGGIFCCVFPASAAIAALRASPPLRRHFAALRAISAPLRCAQGGSGATSLRSGRFRRHLAALGAIGAGAGEWAGGGRGTCGLEARGGAAARLQAGTCARHWPVRRCALRVTEQGRTEWATSHQGASPAARAVSASGAAAAPPAPRHRAPRASPSSRPPGRAPGAASPTDSTPGATQRGGAHAPPRRRSR